MSHPLSSGPSRRQFLKNASAVMGLGAVGWHPAAAEEPPRPLLPRATSGDDVAEPNWDERITVTVGTEGKTTDLVGNSEKVLQAAVDYVTRFGGGTVQILPGMYKAIRMPFNSREIRSARRASQCGGWGSGWVKTPASLS